jgi:hypothetical protein
MSATGGAVCAPDSLSGHEVREKVLLSISALTVSVEAVLGDMNATIRSSATWDWDEGFESARALVDMNRGLCKRINCLESGCVLSPTSRGNVSIPVMMIAYSGKCACSPIRASYHLGISESPTCAPASRRHRRPAQHAFARMRGEGKGNKSCSMVARYFQRLRRLGLEGKHLVVRGLGSLVLAGPDAGRLGESPGDP